MELRVLQYFLAAAREQSISRAAKALHLSQPTLSRQLKDMEEEFGKQLFIRGNRKITLTKEGMLLRKRAEEILSLVQKTEKEISLPDSMIAGEIYIGAGETKNLCFIASAAKKLQRQYPQIHYHISSGDKLDILEQLDKGLIDFGIVMDWADDSKYSSLSLPLVESWGVFMPKNAPLSEKPVICPEDLWDKPLVLARQALKSGKLAKWLKRKPSELNIVSTYSLLYNASLFAEEGFGYVLGFDQILNTTGESLLCSRPLSPALETRVSLIWKKYQLFSPASEKFLDSLCEILGTKA